MKQLPGPMTCGLVHPAIVLPQDAESWNEEDLNRAIVHELEHVRRGDSLSRCLARAACAAILVSSLGLDRLAEARRWKRSAPAMTRC